jgi:hypothetical protein
MAARGPRSRRRHAGGMARRGRTGPDAGIWFPRNTADRRTDDRTVLQPRRLRAAVLRTCEHTFADESRIGVRPLSTSPQDGQSHPDSQRRRRASARRPRRRPRGLRRHSSLRAGAVPARRAAVARALLPRATRRDARPDPSSSMGLRQHHRRAGRTRHTRATLLALVSQNPWHERSARTTAGSLNVSRTTDPPDRARPCTYEVRRRQARAAPLGPPASAPAAQSVTSNGPHGVYVRARFAAVGSSVVPTRVRAGV